jgi:hypothetical protein
MEAGEFLDVHEVDTVDRLAGLIGDEFSMDPPTAKHFAAIDEATHGHPSGRAVFERAGREERKADFDVGGDSDAEHGGSK